METNFSGNIFQQEKYKNKFNISRKKLLLIVISLLVLTSVLGIIIFGSRLGNSFNISADSRAQLQPAKATTVINKEYQFPLRDSKGQTVSNFKYTIEGAELRNEIVVKGQRATAVKGKTFLIINIKLINDYSKAIQVNTRDYIRFDVNGNSQDLLAADIHNDPVTVQAKATKYTRIGLPVSDTQKNFKLNIGELNNNKNTLDINF